MTFQLKPLAQCPHCRPGVGAYLNARALLNYRLDGARGGRLDTEPVRELIVYDSENRTGGPCEHLFDILMDIT